MASSILGAFRATRVVSRGQYSRMMDLGGVPPGKTKHILRTKDGAKHCKLQLVAFDFHILTNSLDKPVTKIPIQEPNVSSTPSKPKPVTVLVDKVQEMASLLNVSLGTNDKNHHHGREEEIKDDLSALTGTHHYDGKKKKDIPLPSDEGPKMPFATDVRAKYADKLKARGTGLAGVNRAKQQVADTLQRGDAAGHLAARAAAVSQTTAETKWMALTGTGTLLMYITNRSMKIALLPPKPSAQVDLKLAKQMQDFTKQLSLVSFDLLIEKGENVVDILKELQHEFGIDPVATMVVSDKDDYLKAAKDEGMISCRIRPKNARRGNISAHYNVETVAQVQDVVNEINGISYSATRATAGAR